MQSGSLLRQFPFRDGLVCPSCGNKDRFIEIMAEETHLVDGTLTYIRLLDAVVDHYACWECGAPIEMEDPGVV